MATIDIPDNMNVLLYDQETVNHLYHSAMGGFWREQPFRFEFVKGSKGTEKYEDNPPEGGVMLWCGDNYLNAYIVYNWYASTVADSCILFDLAENPEPQYCVWVDVKGEWPDNYKEITGE